MPPRYHIHIEPAPPRFRPVGKLGIVDWREDCANCHNCVKRGCVYGFYRDEADTLRNAEGYLDYIYQCKGCLTCVQNCTKNILTRVVNPEYLRLGDEYYTPETLVTIWFQAATGQIPVSGAGYGGPFSGTGFDSMWTDMSEIVRPTRDGIHGREYINTGVDIGRKLPQLAFQDGQLAVTPPPVVAVPLPIVFDVIPARWRRGAVVPAVIRAASELGLYAVDSPESLPENTAGTDCRMIALVDDVTAADAFPGADIVMIPDGGDTESLQAALKQRDPERIVSVRVQATPASAKRVRDLARHGVEVVHLVFDAHGLEDAPFGEAARHMRDVLRDVHCTLVEAGLRDEVTLIASGGIGLAEHVAKAIICGADLTAIDIPLALALECRLCGACAAGGPCPIALENLELDVAVQRIRNLMAAWHQQLIEVLGAMGIREIRRLRGETGRCMFFEDLESETFGRLFGTQGIQQEVR